MSKTILMKVTSRERPKQLLETVKSYIEMAANTTDMVWLFSFDLDCVCSHDDFQDRLKGLLVNTGGVAWFCNGTSTGKINAINRDVEMIKDNWDILLNISDDQRPIVKGYDNIIRNAMPDHLDASLGFGMECSLEFQQWKFWGKHTTKDLIIFTIQSIKVFSVITNQHQLLKN